MEAGFLGRNAVGSDCGCGRLLFYGGWLWGKGAGASGSLPGPWELRDPPKRRAVPERHLATSPPHMNGNSAMWAAGSLPGDVRGRIAGPRASVTARLECVAKAVSVLE